jgi:hypothetical protein
LPLKERDPLLSWRGLSARLVAAIWAIATRG